MNTELNGRALCAEEGYCLFIHYTSDNEIINEVGMMEVGG